MRFDLTHIAQVADELDALCGGDDRLFHDMMQGESDIDRIARRIHEQIARDAETLAGISERQSALVERKSRIQSRHDGAKALIGKLMRAGRLTRLELPEATYSIREGRPALRVVDPDAVPEALQRTKCEPDKTAINEAFADAKELPNWLVRDIPKDVVTARTR